MSHGSKGAGWLALSTAHFTLFILFFSSIAFGIEAEENPTVIIESEVAVEVRDEISELSVADESGAPAELLDKEGFFDLQDIGIAAPLSAAEQGVEQPILVLDRSIFRAKELQSGVKLPEWLVGKSEMKLMRPTAMAGWGDYIYIVDKALSAVIQYDMIKNTMRLLIDTSVVMKGEPGGIYVEKEGSIFVTDPMGSQVLRFAKNGDLQQTYSDKTNLVRPVDVYVDEEVDKIYVADNAFSRIIVFNREGDPLFVVGRKGDRPGEFTSISSLKLYDDMIYVADRAANPIHVLPDIADPYVIGLGRLVNASAVAVDKYGRVYAADNHDYSIHIYADDELLEKFDGGGRPPVGFREISDLWISDDYLYVADAFQRRIQVFKITAPQY